VPIAAGAAAVDVPVAVVAVAAVDVPAVLAPAPATSTPAIVPAALNPSGATFRLAAMAGW
jgi:hypothetical protein